MWVIRRRAWFHMSKHQKNLHFTFPCFFMLFCAYGAFWRKKSNTMKSTCLLFTSNPMYFFLLFYYFFREFSGENLIFFYFFLLFCMFQKKSYFLKCSTFLARFPSILKSREDYFCCNFPCFYWKAWKSTKKHEKVKCRFSWWSRRGSERWGVIVGSVVGHSVKVLS